MEQLEKDSLDYWLSSRRSTNQLEDVLEQIKIILDGIWENNLIHGDLVWFNLGFKYDSSFVSGIDIKLIDFDRSAENNDDMLENIPDASQIDIMRLMLELVDPASNQAPIHKYNRKHLLGHLLKYAKEDYPDSVFNQRGFLNNITDHWIDLYERYSEYARVKGLNGVGLRYIRTNKIKVNINIKIKVKRTDIKYYKLIHLI